MIFILIHGQKRSGKDYVGNLIKEELIKRNINAKTYALANKMKDIVSETFKISREELEEYKNQEKDIYIVKDDKIITISNFRKILQHFATDAMKPIFGNDIWINLLQNQIYKEKPDVAIITDIRFMEEYTNFKDSIHSSYAIKIINKTNKNKDNHISEKLLADNLFDYLFDNTKKDPEEAKKFAKEVADNIKFTILKSK
jgi:hypothetical protein